jgi:cyclopropane fatty-acyl-phospholipid synthase-like methyltransferase
VVDIFRYTDIAEAGAPILNPLSLEKLLLLGRLARLEPGMTQLDLACGKGEMLCRFAAGHGVQGIGIDIHAPFIDLAQHRSDELGVAEQVRFVVGDAGTHGIDGAFDVVSCIGATWIGGGLPGALELMERSLAPGGVILVGEVFAEAEPPDDHAQRHGGTLRGMSDLGGILGCVEAAGLELVEMVIASREDWDRYSARHWDTAHAWLLRHPDHEEAPGIREWMDRTRRTYLADERRWLGWGTFVLRSA